jgi:hypothetical protein
MVQVLYAMQSCEQGVAVLVWQSRIIVLFKLLPPCLVLLARDIRYDGADLLMLGAGQVSPTRFYLEFPNPTCQSTVFCFALEPTGAAWDLKGFENCS